MPASLFLSFCSVRKTQAERSAALAQIEDQKKSVRENLKPEQVLAFKKAFDVFDSDGSGGITSSELGTVISDLGIEMQHREVEKMVQDVDFDGNGEVRALDVRNE